MRVTEVGCWLSALLCCHVVREGLRGPKLQQREAHPSSSVCVWLRA